jgi:hypothetical protein
MSLKMLANYPILKKAIFRTGLLLMASGLLLLIALLTGLLTHLGISADQAQILPGESLTHTFVRLVVLGCMLCALGSLE